MSKSKFETARDDYASDFSGYHYEEIIEGLTPSVEFLGTPLREDINRRLKDSVKHGFEQGAAYERERALVLVEALNEVIADFDEFPHVRMWAREVLKVYESEK